MESAIQTSGLVPDEGLPMLLGADGRPLEFSVLENLCGVDFFELFESGTCDINQVRALMGADQAAETIIPDRPEWGMNVSMPDVPFLGARWRVERKICIDPFSSRVTTDATFLGYDLPTEESTAEHGIETEREAAQPHGLALDLIDTQTVFSGASEDQFIQPWDGSGGNIQIWADWSDLEKDGGKPQYRHAILQIKPGARDRVLDVRLQRDSFHGCEDLHYTYFRRVGPHSRKQLEMFNLYPDGTVDHVFHQDFVT